MDGRNPLHRSAGVQIMNNETSREPIEGSDSDRQPRAPMDEFVRSSSLIFTGTVVDRGRSTLPSLQDQDDLVVVRVDRGLRVDTVLGDLSGKTITVATTAPDELEVGKQAVFFTNSWIHGRGIAVREVRHADTRVADDVAAAVDRLPELDLLDRLLAAELVVHALVRHVSQLPRMTFERNAALWAAAELDVDQVLRGQSRVSTVVHFPTAVGPPWTYAPRFEEGQRGVFLLRPPPGRNLSEQSLEPGSLVALSPADFQPESRLAMVERLLAGSSPEGGAK
jgi:hypothetical protein